MKQQTGLLFFLVAWMIFSSQPAFSMSGTERLPVIYNIVKSEQPDTLGYNIVSSMASILYKGIMDGKIKLWDSRKKEIQLLPSTVMAIEKNNEVRFVDVENVYVYELWETRKKALTIHVMGFEFVKKASDKSNILFGFVEYQDAISLFQSSFMEADADGFCFTTFYPVFMKKQYPFKMVQFGSQVVKTIDESEKIRKIVLERNPYHAVSEESGNDKRISYFITENHRLKEDKKLEKGNLLLSSLSDYLNRNLSIYYRLANIQLSDSLLKNPPKHLRVSKVQVTETWNKNGDYITYQPDSLEMFLGAVKLKTLSRDEFLKWDMVVDFKGMEDYLKEKEFFYVISKVNSQPIERAKSYKYQQALIKADWRQINKYVKETE